MEIVIIYILVLVLTLIIMAILLMAFLSSKQYTTMEMTFDIKEVFRISDNGKLKQLGKIKFYFTCPVKTTFQYTKIKNEVDIFFDKYKGKCLIKNFDDITINNKKFENLEYSIVGIDIDLENLSYFINTNLAKKIKKLGCKISKIKMYEKNYKLSYVKNR